MGYMFASCSYMTVAESTTGCLVAEPDQGFQNPWKPSIPNWSTCPHELSNLVIPPLVGEKLLYRVDKISFLGCHSSPWS